MSFFFLDNPYGIKTSLPYSWNVNSAVQKSLAYSWNVNGAVIKSLAYSWNTRTAVIKSLAYSWNNSGSVIKTLAYSWKLLGMVSTKPTISARYRMENTKFLGTFADPKMNETRKNRI